MSRTRRRPRVPGGLPGGIPTAAWLLWAALPTAVAAQDWRQGESRLEPSSHIQGQVMDGVTRTPMAGVRVQLHPPTGDQRLEEITDAQGRFLFSPLVPGVYGLEVRQLSYEPVMDVVEVSPMSEIQVTVAMAPEALPLEGIVVAVTRRSRLEANGFYHRRARRPGTFITRDQIEARGATELSQVLGMAPFLRTQTLPGGRGMAVVGRGGCIPAYYLDGTRLVDSPTLDFDFHPDQMEAIEVYSSVGAPPQYGGSRCGTVLLWTRQPGMAEAQDHMLARLAIGVVFIVGSFMLTR